jgi:hypothetical protein
MVALRSARLEALLGRRLELVEHSDVTALIGSQVAEAFDLDFKVGDVRGVEQGQA